MKLLFTCIIVALWMHNSVLLSWAMSTAPPQIKVVTTANSDSELISDTPNSNIVLQPELKRVLLICSANYPIKWEFIYNNVSIPILESVYHRISSNINFTDPSENTFINTVTLRGLLESQTGKYVCRHYNRRFENNTYSNSAYFNIFIPGIHVFSEISHVNHVNMNDSEVVIHCPVSDYHTKVKLFKLNEHIFNRTKQLKWKSVYTAFDPSQGFVLKVGLGREILGTYNCSAETGASIISIVSDTNIYAKYFGREECYQNPEFMKLVRSKRLECYCNSSYGLYVNEDFKEENRQADCSGWQVPKNCSDWRVDEFFQNGEDSIESCYFEKRCYNGSGSRNGLRAKKVEFNGYFEGVNGSYTNLTVFYNGFDSWATGFKLAIRRESHTIEDFEVLDTEPTYQHYYPLAHHKAIWNNVVINGTDVISVHVFQPDSLSYDWFDISTDVFEETLVETEMKPSMQGSSTTANSKSTTIQIMFCISLYIPYFVAFQTFNIV